MIMIQVFVESYSLVMVVDKNFIWKRDFKLAIIQNDIEIGIRYFEIESLY